MSNYVAREAEVTTSTTTERNGNRTTTTETVSATYDNGVVDVSIIPYIRGLGIFFKAVGLRPNRRVWFYFDDEDVTQYIVDTNALYLQGNNDTSIFNAAFRETDIIRQTSNAAAGGLLLTQSREFEPDDDGRSRPRRRILRLAGLTSNFTPGQSIIGSNSGNTGTVLNLTVAGGFSLQSWFASTTANTIRLPAFAGGIANNYWGINAANSILFVPRERPGGDPVRAWIGNGTRGYDNVTRTLYLANTWQQLSGISNNMPAIGANSAPGIGFTVDGIHHVTGQQGLGWYTDDEGTIDGVFMVPPGKFKIGQRIFRIIDNSINDVAECTTRAEREFAALGLQQTKQSVTLTNTNTTTIVREERQTRTGGGGGDNDGPPDRVPGDDPDDPIAQSFFVTESRNSQGVFLSSVELFFRSKDEIVPVTVFIRPTVNGYPSSYQNIPDSKVTMPAEFVNVSEDASASTKFTFESPVYLPPGEYALVVFTTSINYEVFVAELGGTIIGTDKIVSEQPYIGSFFKSQNSSTWEADQTKDLKFILNRCVFTSTGEVELYNEKPVVNTPMDIIFTHIEDDILSKTSIDYEHTFNSGLDYYNYTPDTNRIMVEGRQTLSNTTNGQYRLKATLSTSNPDVSPILYHNTGLLNTIENYIDGGSIKDYTAVIQNPGSGYAGCTNISMVITSSYGSGANAYATTNATGSIVAINFDSFGSNYLDTPIVSFPSSNGTTTNAIVTFSSEEAARGGQLLSKYISRVVTLAEGFDAADLRVWLTAYKPSGTDAKVYYKIRNTLDPEPFDSKQWILMKQFTGSNVFSSTRTFTDTREFEYRTISEPDPVSYVTNDGTGRYDTFNQYAVKIVLTSADTTNYPILYDMRAIALPGLSPS